MNGPAKPERHQEDSDPTGVRDLLSSLPGPGPMPPDLVQRINDSLSEEAKRRGHTGDEVSYALFAGRTARARRGPWLKVGAVAASTLFLGGVALSGTGLVPGGPDVLGMVGQRSAEPTHRTVGASSTQGDATVTGSDDVTPTGGAGTPGAGPEGGRVGQSTAAIRRGPSSFHLSTTAYVAGDLRAKAVALKSAPPAQLPPLAAESPHIGPLATPIGLASCLRALGLPDNAAAIVDLSTYDGKPAAVIVTGTDTGDEVRVVRRSCTEGNPALLVGPYAL